MIDVKNNYKFSIIISVYNVEKYIKESIESVINQSIGFIDNVELLLVDDGSTDNSKVICKDFESKYPNNIHYYYKSNGGASSARNLGINISIQSTKTHEVDLRTRHILSSPQYSLICDARNSYITRNKRVHHRESPFGLSELLS